MHESAPHDHSGAMLFPQMLRMRTQHARPICIATSTLYAGKFIACVGLAGRRLTVRTSAGREGQQSCAYGSGDGRFPVRRSMIPPVLNTVIHQRSWQHSRGLRWRAAQLPPPMSPRLQQQRSRMNTESFSSTSCSFNPSVPQLRCGALLPFARFASYEEPPFRRGTLRLGRTWSLVRSGRFIHLGSSPWPDSDSSGAKHPSSVRVYRFALALQHPGSPREHGPRTAGHRVRAGHRRQRL